MIQRRSVAAFGSALLLAAGLAVPASAQDLPLSFGVRVGPSFPVSDLGDLNSTGFAVRADGNYWLSDLFAVGLDLGVDVLSNNDEGSRISADARLWHWGLQAVVKPTPNDSPWNLLVIGGAGGTTFDTDSFVSDPDGTATFEDFREHYFRVNGDVDVSYRFNDDVSVGVRSGVVVVFADEDDTAVFARGNPGVDPFDTAITIPLTVSLNIRLPN